MKDITQPTQKRYWTICNREEDIIDVFCNTIGMVLPNRKSAKKRKKTSSENKANNNFPIETMGKLIATRTMKIQQTMKMSLGALWNSML